MLTGPTAFYDVAVMILDAVRLKLAELDQDEPGRICVVPGAIAWDNCECDNGQLAVAIARQFYSEQIPQELGDIVGIGGCPAPYVVAEIVVQIIRCAPQPDGQDMAPTCEDLDASAQEVIQDAYAVLNGTACRLAEEVDEDISGYLVTDHTYVGPEGACVGSELRVLVALENR